MAFTMLGLLFFGLGMVSLVQMGQMDNASDEVRENWVPSMIAGERLTNQVERLRTLTRRSLSQPSADDTLRELSVVQEQVGITAKYLDEFSALASSASERALIQQVQSAYAEYISVHAQILTSARNGNLDEALRVLNGVQGQRYDALRKALSDVSHFNTEGVNQATNDSQKAFTMAENVVTGVTLVGLALAVLLAVALTRSITRPLSESVRIAEVVASGDLTQPITIRGNDEPARLMAALQRMQQSLHATVQRISTSSAQLASASEELSAVTENSTLGLRQQNQEIEQAAAAVSEMTSAVEEVARNAVSTSEASRGSAATAQHGGQQVQDTVTSVSKLADDLAVTSDEVEKLAEGIREISKVLDVIRAVADQTNLLALNAAIEAARAGDSGRGFAVVADEVRALAHRTQQSTEEIEQMIGGIQVGAEKMVIAMQASNARVHSTREAAKNAGEALEQITSGISAINERNVVIASASEEQAQVAREVDRNLSNIRDLSAQSSTAASQTSAASQELSKLALTLNDTVSQFRI